MKRYDKVLFQYDLQQTILTLFANDPSAMAGTFQEIFKLLLNIHAPIKKKRVRSQCAPWLTPSLGKSMDRLKKVATKSPELRSAYTKKQNKVTKEIGYSAQDYYKGIIEKEKGIQRKCGKQ